MGASFLPIGMPYRSFGTRCRRGLRGHNVLNGIPNNVSPVAVRGIARKAKMYSDEIRKQFYAIAAEIPDQVTRTLIEQLGELMYARFEYASNVYSAIDEAIDGLRDDFNDAKVSIEALGLAFQELAGSLGKQAKANERQQADKTRQLIDRVHTLSNRFMYVEDKTDQTIELLELRLAEILQAVSTSGKNDNGSTDNTSNGPG